MWIDNFVRFLPRTQPTLRERPYDNAMWTAIGYMALDKKIVPPATEDTFDPILPPDLLDGKLVAVVRRSCIDRWSLPVDRFDTSLTRNSTLLPIRVPGYDEQGSDEKLAPKASFCPVALDGRNVTSNDGLRDVLLGQMTERGIRNFQYEVTLCDSNIYRRILKVFSVYVLILLVDLMS
jgi:hypothetical protein